jgi:hypothetical protein
MATLTKPISVNTTRGAVDHEFDLSFQVPTFKLGSLSKKTPCMLVLFLSQSEESFRN